MCEAPSANGGRNDIGASRVPEVGTACAPEARAELLNKKRKTTPVFSKITPISCDLRLVGVCVFPNPLTPDFNVEEFRSQGRARMGVFFTGVDTPRSQVNIEIGGRGGIEINDGILTMFMRWALFSRTPVRVDMPSVRDISLTYTPFPFPGDPHYTRNVQRRAVREDRNAHGGTQRFSKRARRSLLQSVRHAGHV